ncbi:beta-1,3-galactosyltransferase GALT1-like [Chenopodium quinoa]|uniref:Galectin domain-containing protein n=1 Tax=Chenopodium quinoa TaxID=63459 RepID=A0A803L1R5_CHEQI|nr:beta-1,3-galactosyltransferase GALT1-like [Chenopodium quinoa]
MKDMKKWYVGVIVSSVFMLLVLRYTIMQNPLGKSSLTASLTFNATNPFEWVNTNPLEWISSTGTPDLQSPKIATQVISTDTLTSGLFVWRNLTKVEQHSLLTWNQLKHLMNNSQSLPNALEATREASHAWNGLMTVIEEEKLHVNDSTSVKAKEKQCPHYLKKMSGLELNSSDFRLEVPCGLTQGSSVTIIAIPNGLLGNFRIDLTGEHIPGEPDPPIILHYNVRLHGDQITEDPVIVQNTWTAAHDWGEEERCPNSETDTNKKVDELDQCNEMVGKDVNQTLKAFTHVNGSKGSPHIHDGFKRRPYFPFKQSYPFVATLRVGSEGIQMTVDGKHVTSFAYRETLEPWLVSEVRISGDLQLISIIASGLPTSEDIEHVRDLETLKAVPIPHQKALDLFIGVFSTANNFKRRMAVRRTWMQFPEVRSGSVAVRFFVGLHKNQRVNEELWNEARTYGDVQLMPFVDYYSLITWKTVAICVFGTEVVSAKYVMKTDDDAFVRVDEVIASLNKINVTRGLLYGLINSDSRPHRSPDSKWFISTEEWPEETYPPWAHGPGYVVSHDIAKAVSKRHQNGQLKMFKLEDVAMGIWIADMKKEGLEVRYEKEMRVYNEGCKDGYVVAHYQGPRDMLCLWQKLQETKRAFCCGDGMS